MLNMEKQKYFNQKNDRKRKHLECIQHEMNMGFRVLHVEKQQHIIDFDIL